MDIGAAGREDGNLKMEKSFQGSRYNRLVAWVLYWSSSSCAKASRGDGNSKAR